MDARLEAGLLHRRVELICLGVALDVVGTTPTMSPHCPKDAEKLWWNWARFLTARKIPLKERAGHLHSTAWWCRASCKTRRSGLPRDVHDAIESAEVRRLCRIMCLKHVESVSLLHLEESSVLRGIGHVRFSTPGGATSPPPGVPTQRSGVMAGTSLAADGAGTR